MEILIAILVISAIFFSVGYYIGKTITSVKYGAKIDNYKARIEYKDDRIYDLRKKLKREMEKNYARKNT